MNSALILSATAIIVTMLLCATLLRAWSGWLEFRRLELAGRQDGGDDETGLRIELAAVRERLRKLEAIAADVDL